MADLSKVLGGPWSPPPEKRVAPVEDQLLDAMHAAGIKHTPEQVHIDGKMHRFCTSGKRGDAGWYIVFPDGIPGGQFGDWRTGLVANFKADIGRKLSHIEEMQHARRQAEASAMREAERVRKAELASDIVTKIWVNAGAASPEHPYLSRKQIQPHGARVTGDGRLMVPLYSADGELTSLQYIDIDGDKKYHPGGKTGGSFWWLGALEDAKTIYIAEGYATAATIYEVTGQPCVIAYSASSLPTVAGSMRDMYGPQQSIVIVADHDAHGVGQRYADQASAKHGVRVVMPPEIGQDANDYALAGHDLAALLMPATGSAVVEKLQLVFGDQLGDEYEAPNELVEGLMTIGSSVVVYGDSNSGKTFWALSVATAIATGAECYGRRTDPGLVVYLASEAPGSIRSRMQAIKKFYVCNLENLAMVPVPMNFYSGDQDSNDVIELVKAVEQIKGKPVRLIIGDTLARMSAGANENSGEDMGPVMARFDQVAHATGAALMIIHHNGKDQAKGARGWSGIRAHIDTEIEVAEKDGVRSVTVTKQRELPGKGETIYFKLEIIEMGITKFGEAATTCVAIPDLDAESVIPHKKPTKHDENIRTLQRAYWAGGAEEQDGLPYISRNALRELLIADGISERTATNKTEASRKDGMIMPMLNSGIIATAAKGWVIIDPAHSSALLMSKRGHHKSP